MVDLSEIQLFYETWNKALGPDVAQSPTEVWLDAFGKQTKWLPADTWLWLLEQNCPPSQVDPFEAKGFISLVIGMLGQRSPQGQGVSYARLMVDFLDNGHVAIKAS